MHVNNNGYNPENDHAPVRNGNYDRDDHQGCDVCAEQKARKTIKCELCRMGPDDDGFPPIESASEAIDLGWSRTATGLLCEECASEVASNDVRPDGPDRGDYGGLIGQMPY